MKQSITRDWLLCLEVNPYFSLDYSSKMRL